MRRRMLLLCFLTLTLVVGCQGPTAPATVMPSATMRLTPTLLLPSPSASSTPTKTAIPTAVELATPTSATVIPPETRLSLQCLAVEPELPSEASSSGKVVLQSRIGDVPGAFLLDMATGQSSQLFEKEEFLYDFVVSPDRRTLAFSRSLKGAQPGSRPDELILANADGQRQKVIPWEEHWYYPLGWTNDQRLVFFTQKRETIDSGVKWIYGYLAFDPFTGEEEILPPVLPDIVPNKIKAYWDGWIGLIYDPTLTRAIYLRLVVRDQDENFTYALWDVTKQELVATFENLYETLVGFVGGAPTPYWSLDGSSFIFPGYLANLEGGIELFRVSRDGQVEQLTNLTPVAVLQGANVSWSPDASKIAFTFLYGVNENHVALLDLETLDVTDYCIPLRGSLSAPIWSPDSKQFLVVDQYQKDHQQIILVDIVQNFAARIAEDVELVGWLTSEK